VPIHDDHKLTCLRRGLPPICVAGASGSFSCAKTISIRSLFELFIHVSRTWTLRSDSPAYLQYSLDCSMCAQRGLSSKPCRRSLALKQNAHSFLKSLNVWNFGIHSLFQILLDKGVITRFYLDSASFEKRLRLCYLLIAKLNELLGSPADETVHGHSSSTEVRR